MGSQSIIEALGRDVEKLAKDTVIDLIEQIGPITPKLTGQATGGWFVTVGAATDRKVKKLDLTGRKAINSAKKVLSSSTNKFPVFFLTNNEDYIEKLNNGFSKKAPAKFVETAIKRTVNKQTL